MTNPRRRVRIALLAAMVVTACAAAQGTSTAYVQSETPLASTDGTALGTALLGAPVTVTAEDGANAQVTVEGWSIANAASVVFLSADQRIPLVSLTDAGQQARTVLESTTDSYGTAWDHVRLAGSVAAADLGPDLSAVWSKASDLYGSTCSACHALHAPAEFTANQWPGSLKSMLPNVSLTDAQIDLITKYLQYHAKDVAAGG